MGYNNAPSGTQLVDAPASMVVRRVSRSLRLWAQCLDVASFHDFRLADAVLDMCVLSSLLCTALHHVCVVYSCSPQVWFTSSLSLCSCCYGRVFWHETLPHSTIFRCVGCNVACGVAGMYPACWRSESLSSCFASSAAAAVGSVIFEHASVTKVGSRVGSPVRIEEKQRRHLAVVVETKRKWDRCFLPGLRNTNSCSKRFLQALNGGTTLRPEQS